MNYTKKLQLGKPDENEYYDINVINHNMDILDGAIEDRTEQVDLIKTIVSEHMDDTDNPHQITKEQIGMEKVPNVATNDQAVTYTPVVEPKALSSGERLSVAFGKLAGAVADYIVHKANILQRMTVVETGINDLNKNLSVIAYSLQNNHSDTNVTAYRSGSVVRIKFIGALKDAANRNSLNYTLCTLPKDCSPSMEVYKDISIRYSSSYIIALTIQTSGNIILIPYADIPAGSNVWIDETFVI